jgi:hypothetical protein
MSVKKACQLQNRKYPGFKQRLLQKISEYKPQQQAKRRKKGRCRYTNKYDSKSGPSISLPNNASQEIQRFFEFDDLESSSCNSIRNNKA